MTEKNFLLKLPETRAVNYVDVVRDPEGNIVLDASGQPQQRIARTEYVSALVGFDMAVNDASALVQAGHDFFDVQDLRAKLKKAMDRRGRHLLDDKYIILTEKLHAILMAAVKKFNWGMTRKLENGEMSEPITFWFDWFEFFESVRNPIKHSVETPDTGYAKWVVEKQERLRNEEAEEQKAIEEAAAKHIAAPVETKEPIAVAIENEPMVEPEASTEEG